MNAIDYVGWTATAVFVGSYFFRRPATLRLVQMGGASLWIIYGLLMKAPPVIVANVLVLLAAVVTARRAAPTTSPTPTTSLPATTR